MLARCPSQRMTSLSAAEIQNIRGFCQTQDFRKEIDLGGCDVRIVHHVPIGLEIQAVEDVLPPVRLDVFLQIADRTV